MVERLSRIPESRKTFMKTNDNWKETRKYQTLGTKDSFHDDQWLVMCIKDQTLFSEGFKYSLKRCSSMCLGLLKECVNVQTLSVCTLKHYPFPSLVFWIEINMYFFQGIHGIRTEVRLQVFVFTFHMSKIETLATNVITKTQNW